MRACAEISVLVASLNRGDSVEKGVELNTLLHAIRHLFTQPQSGVEIREPFSNRPISKPELPSVP
jgi:hypothetical protein